MEMKDMETMERNTTLDDTKSHVIVITDEILDKYSDPDYLISRDEPHEDRPVLIAEGLYSATMVDWNVGFNPMYKKSVLTMRFQIGNDVILGWFTIQPSNSTTTVKAGWKSNFLRMYQECFDIRLPRRDRIPMSRFNDAKLEVEVMTIGRDSEQKEMAAVNHYSRVKWIHRLL
jgi:hypothetical protein